LFCFVCLFVLIVKSKITMAVITETVIKGTFFIRFSDDVTTRKIGFII
jgi:hypothetical protein